MKLLELLRDYAAAQDELDRYASVRDHLREHAYAAGVQVAGEMVKRAAERLALVEAAFEDELNDLVDRRVSAALSNLRSDAWQ